MPLVNSHRKQDLEKLNVSAEVLAFLLALDAPGNLQHLFNEAFYFYSVGAPENRGDWPEFRGRTLLPLWEHSEAIFVADLSNDDVQYFSFYLECPEQPNLFGRSIYKPLFHMLGLHVWEYGGEEREIAEAVELAERLKFPELDQLRTLLLNPMSSEEDIQAYSCALT